MNPYGIFDSSEMVCPQEGDAFGQMLLAAKAAPGPVFEVTERDDGHVSARDAGFYLTPVNSGSSDGERLSTVDGRVLDVGCGAGRHLAFLAAEGISAMGIDMSAGAVEVCATRGLDARCGNIFDPPASLGRFDVLLMLGGNLGILGDPEQAPLLLQALGRLANPGATLLADGINVTASTDPVHVCYQERNLSLGRDISQVRIRVRYRQLAGAWTSLWFPTPAQLDTVSAGTGWQGLNVENSGAGYRAELTWSQR